jgi:hypothetical protein
MTSNIVKTVTHARIRCLLRAHMIRECSRVCGMCVSYREGDLKTGRECTRYMLFEYVKFVVQRCHRSWCSIEFKVSFLRQIDGKFRLVSSFLRHY